MTRRMFACACAASALLGLSPPASAAAKAAGIVLLALPDTNATRNAARDPFGALPSRINFASGSQRSHTRIG
jgi:hypothetical protein